MKIKRHLLRWHLLRSHTPPPLLHPSCHNCKNSTNTHAHSRIFTLTHTHHFSCSHLFPLTTALSSWCLCAHSLPQLVCQVCVCVFVCVCVSFIAVVPAELRRGAATSGLAAWERKWTAGCSFCSGLLWAVKGRSRLKTQSVVRLPTDPLTTDTSVHSRRRKKTTPFGRLEHKWHRCLFAYRAGKWDLITCGHRKHPGHILSPRCERGLKMKSVNLMLFLFFSPVLSFLLRLDPT